MIEHVQMKGVQLQGFNNMKIYFFKTYRAVWMVFVRVCINGSDHGTKHRTGKKMWVEMIV